MFWNRTDREKKKLEKQKRKEAYDRVYQLHQNAQFLCYINEAYTEEYDGDAVIKLEGSMTLGEGTAHEKYGLYDCKGRWKAELDIDEFYIGGDSVEKLEAADKRVAIYPKQQDVNYSAGDLLCKLRMGPEDQEQYDNSKRM
ncbi:MAG: hypothetical protein J6C01_09365 [Lachnospiraceae bacterium]|nr:hypothetical protein [Lachnospiraceae bacterium]